MPHAGSWKDASLWKQADRFTLPFVPAQLGPTSHGSAPRQKSFLDIDGEHVHLSGIKRSENNDAWIVRLFNSDDRESTAAVTLNGGRIGQSSKLSPTERVSSEFTLPNVDQPCWSMVQQVSLEEVPEVDLSPAENGSVQVVLGPKQIVTLAFKG
jgi:alpha-mannosidase